MTTTIFKRTGVSVVALVIWGAASAGVAQASHVPAPTIEAPAAQCEVDDDTAADFTITGAVDSSDPVAVHVYWGDGTLAGSTVADGDGGWTYTASGVSRGVRSVYATSSFGDGDEESEASASVDLIADGAAHHFGDASTSVARIRPGASGHDRVSVTVEALEPGDYTYALVLQDSSTPVKTFAHSFSEAGTWSFVWNGKTSSNTNAPGGTYNVVGSTSSDDCSFEQNLGQVIIDNTAPRASAFTQSTRTLYPVRDGYVDTVTYLFTLSEPAVVTLQILKGSAVAFSQRIGRRDGTVGASWGGKDASGRLMTSGSVPVDQYERARCLSMTWA